MYLSFSFLAARREEYAERKKQATKGFPKNTISSDSKAFRLHMDAPISKNGLSIFR